MANTNTEIIALLETNPAQAIRGVLDTLYLYNPAPVNELIEQLNEALKKVGFEAIVLDSLPETGKSGTIYFVPSGGETPNVYNEYVWVTETEKFEMVGSAQVDLSNYYTKDEVDDQLIDIVGYIGDETRPLRNDLNQLNKNTIKVADWVNAKDEEGNRAVLETEAQDAYRAINELNQKIGSGGAGLPDQTDNAGKFLTTDGTTTSWGDALVNSGSNGFGISPTGKKMSVGGGGIAIGDDTSATGFSTVSIGKKAIAHGNRCVAIGYSAEVNSFSGNGGIALGAGAINKGKHTLHINTGGETRNSTTTEVDAIVWGNSQNDYVLFTQDGTIPTDRYTTTPTTAGTYVPKLTVAEDGTATREWGTASGGGGGGDYLPLSGGTLTGVLNFDYNSGTYGNENLITFPAHNGALNIVRTGQGGAGLIIDIPQTAGGRGGNFRLSGNGFYPNSSNGVKNLGSGTERWKTVFATRLCSTSGYGEGNELIIPDKAGTLARLEDLEDMVTIKEYD